MQQRSVRWIKLIGGLSLVALGTALLFVNSLPPVVRRYWPVVLIAWGAWKWVARYRVREDAWAGTDYGTGLYVIRRRRREPRAWLPGFVLIVLGGAFLWANFDPAAGVTIGPIVLIALGLYQMARSFASPPRSDFSGGG